MLLLFVVFLISSIGVCFYLNSKMHASTFADMTSNVNEVLINAPEAPFEKRGYYTDSIYDDSIESLDDLYSTSDLVAIVTPISSRQDSMVMKTDVKIERVIQGTQEMTNENVTVFEQYFYDQFGRLNINVGCTLPMKLNTSYLLFLRINEDYPSKSVYRLTSLYYGKFPTTNDLKSFENSSVLTTEESKKVFNKDILDYDVAFLNVQEEIEYASAGLNNGQDEYLIKYLDALRKYEEVFKKTYISFFEELQNIL